MARPDTVQLLPLRWEPPWGRALRCRAVPLLALVLGLVLAATIAAAPAAAEFSGVDYTLTNQSEQDFHGQDLANTSFAGAVGRRANFAGANLHGAILTQGAFPEADFRGADLGDVLMDKVDFSGADFTGAVLRGVIASGSSFSGAIVTDADFTDALLDRVDQRALCREASGTNPVTGADTRLSLGCP
ncbi:MAG: pentapeptide repeat-containing protein [Cyanobacteriota bacterium]